MPTEVAPFQLITDRWLIEALSQMSSNPHVRDAARTWLSVYASARSRGLTENEAQSLADDTLQPATQAG